MLWTLRPDELGTKPRALFHREGAQVGGLLDVLAVRAALGSRRAEPCVMLYDADEPVDDVRLKKSAAAL